MQCITIIYYKSDLNLKLTLKLHFKKCIDLKLAYYVIYRTFYKCFNTKNQKITRRVI